MAAAAVVFTGVAALAAAVSAAAVERVFTAAVSTAADSILLLVHEEAKPLKAPAVALPMKVLTAPRLLKALGAMALLKVQLEALLSGDQGELMRKVDTAATMVGAIMVEMQAGAPIPAPPLAREQALQQGPLWAPAQSLLMLWFAS
jgi:hypothetical protein